MPKLSIFLKITTWVLLTPWTSPAGNFALSLQSHAICGMLENWAVASFLASVWPESCLYQPLIGCWDQVSSAVSERQRECKVWSLVSRIAELQQTSDFLFFCILWLSNSDFQSSRFISFWNSVMTENADRVWSDKLVTCNDDNDSNIPRKKRQQIPRGSSAFLYLSKYRDLWCYQIDLSG